MEHTIRSIWEDVLGHTDFSNGTSFFVAGGDSLRLMRMASYLEQEYKCQIPLGYIVEYPTVSGIVEYLKGEQSGSL